MSSSIKEASSDTLTAHHKTYHFFSLARAAEHLGPVDKLPESVATDVKLTHLPM